MPNEVQLTLRLPADLVERADGYVLALTIEHLGASYNDGVETLVPVLPTCAIDAFCDIRVVLRDRAGRVYLNQRFDARKRSVTAALAGIRSTAAANLGAAIRVVADQVLPAVHAAVPAFWKRLGRRPPGGGPRVSPPRGPRSSTAR